MAKYDNPSVGEVFREKEYQCVEVFRFKDGGTKCTFVRKENSGDKENPNWQTKTFYHVINDLPEDIKPSQIVLRSSNIVEMV